MVQRGTEELAHIAYDINTDKVSGFQLSCSLQHTTGGRNHFRQFVLLRGFDVNIVICWPSANG